MNRIFTRVAAGASSLAGNPLSFVVAALLVVAWAVSGPSFGFSETWQLVINTGTTISTFLMVFLLQNAQNRDAIALQVKLDELLRAVTAARNAFIGIEHETADRLNSIRDSVEQET